MNSDIFGRQCGKKFKGKMKQAWGKLTDDDFKTIEGSHQEVYGTLQKQYGYTKDESTKSSR